MEIKELKSKSQPELKKLLGETRERLRELRFKAANGQLKDVRDIREQRRIIARILTLTNEPTKRS